MTDDPPPTSDLGRDRWRVGFASVAGVSHRAGGRPNEDACLVASRRDGTLLLAAADGAGSAPRAAEGSRLAVETWVRRAGEVALPDDAAGADAAWGGLLLGLLADVRRALLDAAGPGGGSEVATTLLACLLTPTRLACLQLGDGAVVARTGDGLVRPTAPSRGAYAGETTFVTSSGALASAEIALLSAAGLDGVALLTDGLEPVATDLASGAPHRPFFDGMFAHHDAVADAARRSADLDAFLRSERVGSRTHDDLTLALAVRAEAP